MRVPITLALLSLAALPGPCRAGAIALTPEFRAQATQYCTDDVMRLCPQTIFDEEQTSACMQAHRAQLSPTCRAIFNRGLRTQRAR